ncbi:hypothetical protein CI109_101377 [Kwoniella shandongensis]|uniref:Uncharacterized protein n=1 Tax=Kwoniella shandongensis TaxID=1734106 RepID=A0A5M6BUT5_9TREE|nr:uncharacterized protein CI109_005075 [Kwoniella shandongensis]KAA5526503.1 hypothetical protein CI109_005075 [Kwoniella shandongensis]
MSGHVSMMNDVLISQMPTSMLRSAMRSIISKDPTARQLLLQHVRERLTESPPRLPSASDLFPSDDGDLTVLETFLSTVRCYFSSHLVVECLPSLIHLVESVKAGSASWTPQSDLERTLETSASDIIQAIQALKESKSRPEGLEGSLLELLQSLDGCNRYCVEHNLSQPYTRAQTQVADALSLLYPSAHINGYAQPPRQTDQFPVDFSAESISTGDQVERILLGGKLSVPRMFNGLWQMSSPAWGSASASKMDEALLGLVRHGLVATDMADHYGDAELVYGSFRNRLPFDVADQVIAATKWCVFAPLTEPVSEQTVLAAVQERVERLGGRVELLQFHWQDYDNKDYLVIIKYLVQLTQTRPDLVSAIGLCNFDAKRTEEVCEYMVHETGEVGIVSNQVQFSLIDSRPIFAMAAVCATYKIHLLTYGSFCGGFLSDKWLNRGAPDGYGEKIPLTPSQRKYLDMIYTWGDWKDFSHLLTTLHDIALVHQVDVANVATRWVLQRPEVGAVIVGTRLGVSSNAEANLQAFTFELSPDEIATIELAALGEGRAKALKLFKEVGDCGQEYR